MEQVRFHGGAHWLFTIQNDQILRKRQNVKAAEERRTWENEEKIVFRALYQADYKNTTYLYDCCLVGFKKKREIYLAAVQRAAGTCAEKQAGF